MIGAARTGTPVPPHVTARREAFIGSVGLCSSGEYRAARSPCRLVLTFGSYNGYGAVQVARMIPIPEGCERDLAVLQERLPSCCPKATVQLAAPASRLA